VAAEVGASTSRTAPRGRVDLPDVKPQQKAVVLAHASAQGLDQARAGP
jgi:hypothetical protein